jgi:acyl-CoA reductase-like NAD-dependent aldehyde dehydrogenase
MAIASINPATGEKLEEFSPFTEAEINTRLERAERALPIIAGSLFRNGRSC